MPLITLLLVLVVLGVFLWGVSYVPWIHPKIKQVIYVVAVVGIVFWLLNVFGLLTQLNTVKVR